MTKSPAPPPLAPPSNMSYMGPVLVLSPTGGGYYFPTSPAGGAYGYMYSPVMTPQTMAHSRMLFRREDAAILPTPLDVPISPHPLLTPVALRHREKLAASAALAYPVASPILAPAPSSAIPVPPPYPPSPAQGSGSAVPPPQSATPSPRRRAPPSPSSK